jgi:hypothetical protein
VSVAGAVPEEADTDSQPGRGPPIERGTLFWVAVTVDVVETVPFEPCFAEINS